MLNNTNEKIRYAAFKFFLEKGYEATNIRDICEEVDIKTSSLYFYYKSKSELFFSIYDDICNENIRNCQELMDLNQTEAPDIMLYNLYRGMIYHYVQDITKQKFLLRYHLFPPEEISGTMREKYKYLTNEEKIIIEEIIRQCLEKKILSDNKSLFDYAQEYMKYEKSLISEMIISNIKMSDAELVRSWEQFWKGTMLNR